MILGQDQPKRKRKELAKTKKSDEAQVKTQVNHQSFNRWRELWDPELALFLYYSMQYEECY